MTITTDTTAAHSPALAAALAERAEILRAGRPGDAGTHAVGGPSRAGFGPLLEEIIRGVDIRQQQAAESAAGVLRGGEVPLHKAMLDGEEASVSFQLMLEVRNKLMDGYQELMRMHQ